MATVGRPVNRSLTACAGAVVVTCGLYLADQVYYLRLMRDRSPGVWTASGLAVLLLLALAGAGLSALFDRRQRPRGIFILGLVLLLAGAVLNLAAMPGLSAFGQYPRESLFWAAGIGLFIAAWFGLSRAGLWSSLFFVFGFLALALAWSVYPFDVIFSSHPARWVLSALFIATLFGASVRVRRRLLRPLRWDLAAAIAALVVAGAIQTSAHLYLSARGEPPRPAADGIEWPKPSRPILVLVVWDTARRDHLSLYGYERKTTPLLEQWAREAKVFTNARTVAPCTLPSHASMFTGLYPRSHGSVWTIGDRKNDLNPLDEKFTTLAELLNQSGYSTGGIVANSGCAGRLAGMDQGFEYLYDQTNARAARWPAFRMQGWLLEVLTPVIPPRFFSPYLIPTMPAEEVTDRALTWIDSLDRDRPFFLFLNYMDAHHPTYPPEDLRYLFPGFQRDLIGKGILGIFSEVLERNQPLTDRERGHLVSQYDAQLVRLDRETDRLRRELQRRGILDNAFLVLVSDHGEAFGEHGLIAHSNDVYDPLLRIPMVIRMPHAEGAGTEARPIENRDLFRMFLDEAGVKPAPVTSPWDQAAEYYPMYLELPDGLQLMSYARTRRAVFFGGYKFISSSDGRDELYDLTNDPTESRNLIAASPLQGDQGRSLVEVFRQTIPETKNSPAARKPLDPEHERNLRALGYIQ